MEKIIEKAQLRNDINWLKGRIKYHKRIVNQLQIMGMGLTDQLNQLEKEEAAEIQGKGKS